MFGLLGLPLPWMLGALCASAAASIGGFDWALPASARNLARPVIGVLAGSAFTAEIAGGLLHHWQVMPVLLAFLLATPFLGRAFFVRLCGFDRVTAFFASTMGGLSELTLLGGHHGGDMRRLVLVHAVRVIAVVFLVPFAVRFLFDLDPSVGPMPVHAPALAAADWLILIACGVLGTAIGWKMRIPSGAMIVPLLLSAACHIAGLTVAAPPGWLVAGMQVLIGCIVGARFAGIRLRDFHLTILQSLAWTALLLIAALMLAFMVSGFVEVPREALLLAFAPGGIAEMTTVAFAIGTDVAFVVTCHVLRVTFLVLAAPWLFRLGLTRP